MNKEELYNEFGVTSEQLDAWAEEYESGDWSNMKFGKVSKGRPRIADDPLESITIKVPRSRLIAMKKLKEERGLSRSDFVREAIDEKLIAIS